jgi:hypothetical protein
MNEKTLILLRVFADYHNVAVPGGEDEHGNPIFSTWTEERRDWWIEDRADAFPVADAVSVAWSMSRWDYDTRFGLAVSWLDNDTKKRAYGVLCQLLDCMDRADKYSVQVSILPVTSPIVYSEVEEKRTA